MLLVLDRDTHLDLFESVAAAERQLETIDIENKEYEICDEIGQQFVGEILAAVTVFSAGRFRLVQFGSPDPARPLQIVMRARFFGRALGELKNLADVRRRFSTES
jgi:hypothetical protein